MVDLIMMMLGDFSFWARVLIACAIWYTLACVFARCQCRTNQSELWSNKAAPWLALLFTAPLAGIAAWFWWNDVLMAILLGITTLIFPLLFLAIFSSMESAMTKTKSTNTNTMR